MATPAGATAAAGSTATSAAAPGAATAGGAASAAPVTGNTVDVKMIGDAKGYRFEPSTLTIKVGDGVKFTNVSGGPHDVSFWPDSIPAGTSTQLEANMPNTMQPLVGPLLTAPNQTYTVSFAGLKPGVYHFYCTPHLAMGMVGTITVQ
jgi:plastocyanin